MTGPIFLLFFPGGTPPAPAPMPDWTKTRPIAATDAPDWTRTRRLP
jgi:hypothetical protein